MPRYVESSRGSVMPKDVIEHGLVGAGRFSATEFPAI